MLSLSSYDGDYTHYLKTDNGQWTINFAYYLFLPLCHFKIELLY